MLGLGMGGAALEFYGKNSPFPDACAVRTGKIAGPSGWSGRKILFITDIHYGRFFGPSDAAQLGRIVSHLNPDAVMLGGDLAESPDTDLSGFLAGWSPKCPTIFTPGNHDLFPGMLDSPVLQQAAAGGFTVLSNAAIPWNGIHFIGLPSALRTEQRLELLQASGLKIVLAHEPDLWDRYDQPDLVHLAGHTHGGQIRFLGHAICLPTLGQKFPLGQFFKERNNRLIVSAGLGCTTAPVRINCPPEIVRLEFV